jgi:DNA repair exonuclease SbcCD ATPase subunit
MTALNDITVRANSYLAKEHLSIFFQFERAKKSDDGFKPVFETMVINQYGKTRELDDCSGAEFVLVNFSLRLALSSIIASKYGFEYIIMDEGMKDLDDLYVNFVASVLQSVSNQFQIFVISHMKAFAESFPNSILVRKQNGVAQVILNG